MHSLLQYSLESALCLTVLLLPYLLWFRKMTFHQWNRFYLLGAIFFSLTAPSIDIEIKTASTPEIVKLKEDIQLFEETPTDRPITKIENSPSKPNDITAYKQPKINIPPSESAFASWDVSDFLISVYFLGFSVFMGMFLYRLTKLFKLIDKGNKIQEHGFTAINVMGKQVFSFFHFVFFDHNRYNEKEQITLLEHEKVHIQQWHSVDVLILEILQLAFWFNPLFRFYKKLLQQEHEYFVDIAISSKFGKLQYAQLLLNYATNCKPLLGHAFAYIPIKHRIFNLLQKPSTSMEKSKFLIALPLILTLFFTFSCSLDELEKVNGDTIPTGNQVKSVQAYFVDEQSALKQETDVGNIKLNEDGTIANLEMKKHPIFGSSIPNNFRKGFLWEYNAAFFEGIEKKSRISNDFFSKRAQWIIAGDPKIHAPELSTILFYENGKIWLNTEKDMLSHSMGFDIYDMTNNSNEIAIKGKKSDNINDSWVQRKVNFKENGQILSVNYQKKRKSKIFSYNTGNTLMDSILRSQRRTVASEDLIRFEIDYYLDGKLESIKPFGAGKMILNDGNELGQTDNLSPKDFMYFTHDDKGNVDEIHLIKNENNTFLRKYRFHYNEAGYCTKKECINREGNIEFSVRFEYDFFD